jgi:hypothetical protein
MVGGFGGDGAWAGVGLGAEAQQGGDVADFIEVGIVFDVKEFDVAADHPGQKRFSNID